jgi:hypothetical protein
MKRNILFIILLIFLVNITMAQNSYWTLIPGTKVIVDLPDNYSQGIFTNTFTDNGFSGISVSEIPFSIEQVLSDFTTVEINGTFNNQKIINLEYLGPDILFIELTGKVKNLNSCTYVLITGNEFESVSIIGSTFEIVPLEDREILKNTIQNAIWDYSRTRDFSEVLFYYIKDSLNFTIKTFLGDRFIYKYNGENFNQADEIQMNTGTHFHNYDITYEMYSEAAKNFSFRPPFENRYEIINIEEKKININNLPGIQLVFTCKTKESSMMTGINYILFIPNRIIFLRTEILSTNPDFYLPEIQEIFNSFALN